MIKDYFQQALLKFNTDIFQWYGFKKEWTGEKRESYENIILNDDSAILPSEAEVNAKIQELKDAETAYTNARTTGKAKLKSGEALTDAEIKALFGDN
tara:strand:- start:46 stop:336 length:291 start_codon:yes stop_codon:yes gene_type:complete